MTLEERLNLALNKHGLVPKVMVERENRQEIRPEVKQEINGVAETLDQALRDIKTIQPDADGVRAVLVKTIDMNNLCLPMNHDDLIIDDVQKRIDGLYEVHILHSRRSPLNNMG